MSSAIADRYRRWFEYERDAHAKVLASLDTVPADRRDSPEFRRGVTILGHIAAARRVWLFRLGRTIQPPKQFFPENVAVEDVAAELRGVEALWTEYLARCDDAELGRVFDYQSMDSGRFRNRIEDILAQLFGHSWYHRGQIAMLVKAAGGQPAITDLIYWCRENVG